MAENVIGLLRMVAARRGAIYTYTAASERHATRETALLMLGFERAADTHHRADLLALRALKAEQDDPSPRRAEGGCGVCPGPCDECDLCGVRA
jgi:hypothetical protein